MCVNCVYSFIVYRAKCNIWKGEKGEENDNCKLLFGGLGVEENLLILSYNKVSILASLEKAMIPHSSTLAWKIPWTEEPGRLQSMGSLRVGHGWTTSLSLFTFMHWRRKWQPQCSCLENPRDGEAWWAAVYGVAQSQTRLKRQQQQHPCIIKFCFISWHDLFS